MMLHSLDPRCEIPTTSFAWLSLENRSTGQRIHPGRSRSAGSCLLWVLCRSLDLLEVQVDPHTVDQDNALADQLLVCNVRICEFPHGFERTHELERFGRVSSSSSQIIQNGDVEAAKFCVIRNAFKD